MNIPVTKGIHHLGLTVSKLEESANFFISLLGWKGFRFGQAESNRQTRSTKTKMSGCTMSHFKLRAKLI